jgi:hypothetical protein
LPRVIQEPIVFTAAQITVMAGCIAGLIIQPSFSRRRANYPIGH